MITTKYYVKKAWGLFDGDSVVTPDADYDETKGYFVGYRLLVTDGDTWVCRDSTVGLAVWDIDPSEDIKIALGIRSITDVLVRYLDGVWLSSGSTVVSDGISFGPLGLLDDLNGKLNYYAGDTILIDGSKRNDGFYDVEVASSTQLAVTPVFPLTGADEETITITGHEFPLGLQVIAGNMVAYDIFTRSNSGLESETIGTYSYSKTVDIGGLGYPGEVVSGIMNYKRPKIR